MKQANPHLSDDKTRESAHSVERRRQSAAVAEVPERPALAPNVQLVGELQDAGFEDRQWLIQRGERFIQVTELLYRIAEQANGERTLKEIAEGVTASTEWMVTADNVRQLIRAKLLPMRLISAPGDSFMAPDPERRGSPLAFLVRKRVFGPRVIEPITGMFQFLYKPFILVPLFVAIAFAHEWLYLRHGVIRSFIEVLYTPGLLLAVLAVLIVAGVFHEFGHASALRYGGGKVRGMGVGLYLIYPAFYTDTTDSYRLGRWARVRTDLGGFYFYLIFALGLIGLYLATGWEFLLVVVLLINLDILCQCLPFARFDGYWTLADLTGIPDFFSQTAAFVRSMLPTLDLEGDKLPELKPWVKVVFATYVVLTIPALALLLCLLLVRLPFIVATVWDSLLVQAEIFSAAQISNDFLDMVASGSQMLMLALPLVGIAYLFYRLGRSLLRAIWSWSAKNKEQAL